MASTLASGSFADDEDDAGGPAAPAGVTSPTRYSPPSRFVDPAAQPRSPPAPSGAPQSPGQLLSVDSECFNRMFEDPDEIDARLAHAAHASGFDEHPDVSAGVTFRAPMFGDYRSDGGNRGGGAAASGGPTAGAGGGEKLQSSLRSDQQPSSSSAADDAPDLRTFALDPDVNWRETSLRMSRPNILWRPFAEAVVEAEYQRYADSHPFTATMAYYAVTFFINALMCAIAIPAYELYEDNVVMAAGLAALAAMAFGLVGHGVVYARKLRLLGSPLGLRNFHIGQSVAFAVSAILMAIGSAPKTGTCTVVRETPSVLCFRTPRAAFLLVVLSAFIVMKHPVYFGAVCVTSAIGLIVAFATVGDWLAPVDLLLVSVTCVFFCACLLISHFIRDIATRLQFVELLKLAATELQLSDQRNRIALIVRCAVPARVAARLANSATMQLPRDALTDEATKATVCITAACDFEQWCTGLLLTQVVSALHHLYTVFDAATAVFGVDHGGTLGDEYVVTTGLVRGSQSNAAHAAFFALWQHNIREARVVTLRSCIATGQLAGGVVGGTSIRYIINGEALDVAQRALQLVEDDMVWCTASTLAEITKRAPGLFAACPEVEAAGLYSLHPTSRAIDPDSSLGNHDDDTATIKTAQVDEAMKATKLWLSGHESAATLTEERRSSAFIVGEERLAALNTTGITVLRDEATGASRVPELVDFAKVALEKLRPAAPDAGQAPKNLSFDGLNASPTGAQRHRTPNAKPSAARVTPEAMEEWQRPHRPKLRALAGVFVDEADETAYREYTAASIRRAAPSLFAAGVIAQLFMLAMWLTEHFMDSDVVSPHVEHSADIAALAVCGFTVLYLGGATVWAARVRSRLARDRAPQANDTSDADGGATARTPEAPPHIGIYVFIGATACMLLALPIAIVDQASVYNHPWFFVLAMLGHMTNGSARYLPWYQSQIIFTVIFCVPAIVLSAMSGSVEAYVVSACVLVLAGVCSRLGSQRFRAYFCVAYDVRAKASAVQQCVVLLQQLARCLLPPHVVDLGLRSTELEVRRQLESGEATAEPHEQLAAVQRLVHHIEPTDRLADCVVVRAQLEPGRPHNTDAFFQRWAAVGELLRQSSGGTLQQVETLGDSIVLAGPFGQNPGDGVFEAAYAAIGFLYALQHTLRLSFEAVCGLDEAYGSLLGRGMMRYALLGVGVRHASALLANAPRRPGTAVAYLTRSFLQWLVDEANARRLPPPPPLPHGMRPALRWRVRSVGLTYVWPVVFDAPVAQPLVNSALLLSSTSRGATSDEIPRVRPAAAYHHTASEAESQPGSLRRYSANPPVHAGSVHRGSYSHEMVEIPLNPVDLATQQSPVVVVTPTPTQSAAASPAYEYDTPREVIVSASLPDNPMHHRHADDPFGSLRASSARSQPAQHQALPQAAVIPIMVADPGDADAPQTQYFQPQQQFVQHQHQHQQQQQPMMAYHQQHSEGVYYMQVPHPGQDHHQQQPLYVSRDDFQQQQQYAAFYAAQHAQEAEGGYDDYGGFGEADMHAICRAMQEDADREAEAEAAANSARQQAALGADARGPPRDDGFDDYGGMGEADMRAIQQAMQDEDEGQPTMAAAVAPTAEGSTEEPAASLGNVEGRPTTPGREDAAAPASSDL